MNGYMHPWYAKSLSEFGAPRELPRCRGWILERRIPGSLYKDAMGCYPLFACQDWSKLHLDLDEIRDEDLVSLALVADPFGEYDEADLRTCFQDLVIPFKEHFVVDLCRPMNKSVSQHHHYYAQKTLKKVIVETCSDPARLLDEWAKLYATLIKKHELTGIRAFSRMVFARQLRIPGLVIFRAVSDGITVGMHLWYVQGEVAYSHLAAFSLRGYELMVSYAIYWSAIEYFAGKVRWLDLGAGAGVKRSGIDGLSQFKRGWSTGTRITYFCGRIFNRERYMNIVETSGISAADYFPAYRKGEFR
jgi:Acetyltransferase (GNAT) domain